MRIIIRGLILFSLLLISGCRKEVPEDYFHGTVTDIDGNVYKTIRIGSQVWMAENLKVTHYRNGNPIPRFSDNREWSADYHGMCCDYDLIEHPDMGLLYNWYAVEEHEGHMLAPDGWHIPSEEEWQVLVNYLGGKYIAGAYMKDTAYWVPVSMPKSVGSGFRARPAGERDLYGYFSGINDYAYYWAKSISTQDIYRRVYLRLDRKTNSAGINATMPDYGFSVRCIKD